MAPLIRRADLLQKNLPGGMEKNRIATGIAGFDPLIEGGFPAGKSYLITGCPGAGKSIFCMQFVLQGLAAGEKAVYVAIDETPAEIIEQAASLGLDLAKYTDTKELLILDASSHFSKRAGTDKEVDLQRAVTDLSNYVNRMGARRLVIDPVGPLILLRDSVSRIQDQARQLIHSLQTTMKTTNLLTCYPVPRIGEQAEHGVEEYLVAGVIVLRLKRTPDRCVRTLAVEKMRATAIDLREREFTIDKGRGIALTPLS
jgi:circadian clock protein KaiC